MEELAGGATPPPEEFRDPHAAEAERKLRSIHRAVDRSVRQWYNSISPGATLSQRKNALLENVEKHVSAIFLEKRDALDRMLRELNGGDSQTDEELCAEVVAQLTRFMNNDFSISELESRVRKALASQNGWVEINRLFMCGAHNDAVDLHIPPVFDVTPRELKKLFVDGLKELAGRLSHDPVYAGITKVTGESWIIYEHPAFIERMGFHVLGFNEQEHVGMAEISRAHLLELYGAE